LEFNHKPVLLTECITGLNIKPKGIYVDGTMGGAGHSKKIVEKLSKQGRLIGIDRDTFALETAKSRLKDYQNVTYVHGNHDEIREILDRLNIKKVDGILLDLGVSSYQIDEKQRGFSYKQDSTLDMRMDQTQSLTAIDVINTYTEEKLASIIYEYGEEKFSRQIAKKICEERAKNKITTTQELVKIIKEAIPYYDKNAGHPAKRTFQAIRIEVNDEIRPLKDTVKTAIECLNNSGRLCIITFHSLEDRAVKMAYQDAIRKVYLPKRFSNLCMWSKETRKNYYKETN
jgi:16S rRNA (cytosine1402-N4)-methyltransferase